jgi:hypothetical protein
MPIVIQLTFFGRVLVYGFFELIHVIIRLLCVIMWQLVSTWAPEETGPNTILSEMLRREAAGCGNQ